MASISDITLDKIEGSATASIDIDNAQHLSYPLFSSDEPVVNDGHRTKNSDRQIQSDKLYVGNLSPDVNLVDLHKSFKRFGEIADIQLPYNTGPGGKPRGYAFVLYTNKDDAAKAHAKLDGTLFGKRILKIDYAHQDVRNTTSSKNKKGMKDANQVTTLSLLKSGQHGRNTNEQIAMAEAKLRQLHREDMEAEASTSNPSSNATQVLHHPSLPAKPPSAMPSNVARNIQPSSTRSSTTSTPKASLPSLPMAPLPKLPIFGQDPSLKPSMTPPLISRSGSSGSGSAAAFSRKSSKLSGVKITKRPKNDDVTKP